MDMDRFWIFMGILIIIYAVCTFMEMPFTTKQMLESYTPESVSKYCKQTAIPMAVFGVAFIVDSYSSGNQVLTIVKWVLYALGGLPIIWFSFKTLKRKEKKTKSLRDVTGKR